MMLRKICVLLLLCVGNASCSGTPSGVDATSMSPLEVSKNGAVWPVDPVKSISARVVLDPRNSRFTTEFFIKKPEIGRILRALRPPVAFNKADAPPIAPEFECGHIRVKYENKDDDRIIFYSYGKNTLVFSINGRLHFRGSPPGDAERSHEHLQMYGINAAYIDESSALSDLLVQCAESPGSHEEKGTATTAN